MGKSLVTKVLDKRNNLNKISLFAIRYSLFAIRYSLFAIQKLIPIYLIPLFLIPLSTLTAQVIIKEKVEINPQVIQPDYPAPQYTPCGPYPGMLDIYNPRQAVWNGSSFWLDPFQQLFNSQQSGGYATLNSDHYYNIETIAGGEYFSITKLGGIDPITGEFIEPEVMGNTLLNVMGVDLIGTGNWVFSGCGTYQKENTPDYQCHFSKDAPQGTEVIVKITDLTQGGSPTYFHTFIEIPSMITDEGSTFYIQHYYSQDISMWVYDPGNCSLGCGGHLPSWVTFTVEIVQGQEYGSIHNLLTDESADYFTNIETIASWTGVSEIKWFEFVANGAQPDTSSPAHVIIKYTPSDASVGIVEYNFYVEYNDVVPVEEGILVQFADSVIAPGDTTEIILRRQNSDGTIEDFSQWDGFEVGMIDGCNAGKILVGITLDVYFEEVYQPIYFVADSNLTETDTVKVRVGLIEGISTRPVKTGEGEKESKAIDSRKIITGKKIIKKTKEPEPLPMNPTTYCFIGEIDKPYMGDGAVVVKDESIEIMLGETKYYQAKYDDIVSGKLVITELSGPNLWNGGLTTDVWGNDPVTISAGDKLGVYWEKEKPIWKYFRFEYFDNKGKKKIGYRKEKIADQPIGLIRLVGRYWEGEKTYKVKLTARTTNGDQASIEIEVKRPTKFGPDKPLGVTYINFTDVFGQPDNVNEYCIREAGREGIPPQLPKAQAFKESIPKFAPNYRYEPWKNLEFNNSPKFSKQFFKYGNNFVVTENSMGGNSPSTLGHSNLGDANYPDEPTTAAEIIARDLETRYWNSNGYCVNSSGNDITELYKFYFNKLPHTTDIEIKEAKKKAINLVKEDLKKGKIERYNFIAQSRIVASYNPFQQTYYNAVEWELYNFRYTNSNFLPELLNEPEHQFETYISRIKKVFMENKSSWFNNYVDLYGNNWPLGYEGTWDLYEDTYNHGEKTYHTELMYYYQLFEPKKEH